MDSGTLARYTGVPRTEIDRLLSMSGGAVVEDAGFMNPVGSIDITLLKQSLPATRAAYEEQLPALRKDITGRYGVNADVMSAHTLGNWIVGALEFPQYISSITSNHTNVPREVFVNEMPQLLAMVEDVPDGGTEWQKALCIFVLPLMTKN
ncbi:MAG: hypothetical protein AAF653_05950 [Chloroflexota bacterium]